MAGGIEDGHICNSLEKKEQKTAIDDSPLVLEAKNRLKNAGEWPRRILGHTGIRTHRDGGWRCVSQSPCVLAP